MLGRSFGAGLSVGVLYRPVCASTPFMAQIWVVEDTDSVWIAMPQGNFSPLGFPNGAIGGFWWPKEWLGMAVFSLFSVFWADCTELFGR